MGSSFMSFVLWAFLAASQTVFAVPSAWHMDGVGAIANERLDPIVSPNAIGGHMHNIMGGSAFAAYYNPSAYTSSKCTTAPISVDHSNYWLPKLYWINNGGTSFTPLSEFRRFYYALDRNSDVENLHAFPPGLRMLVGNPNSKVANSFVFRFTCHIDANGAGDLFSESFNFGRDCPYGMKVTAGFPQCWDGINLYKSDMSHMSYPTTGDPRFGACPWSHPYRVPYIFIEYNYGPTRWAPGQALAGNLAWANGDTTGFGVHADFVNGWDVEVLQAALNNTNCLPQAETTFAACETFAPYNDPNAAAACVAERGQMDELSGANVDFVPISRLPGCNSLWGTGPKPACPDQPADPDVSAFQGTDGAYLAAEPKAPVLPTKPGWSDFACLKDSNLLQPIISYDTGLTKSSCQAKCLASGYRYAAVSLYQGYRWSCQCGTGIDPASGVVWGMCTLPCPGSATETCGNSGISSVSYAPAGTTVAGPASNGYMGCYQEASTTPTLATTAFYNYAINSLTVESCLQSCVNRKASWAGLRYGNQCYCGRDNTYNLNGGYYTTDYTCNAACGGNSTEICGGVKQMSVYNISVAALQAAAPLAVNGEDQGCWAALGNVGLTNWSYADSSLTPQRCTYACAEMGWPLAATVNGQSCQCGDRWVGGQNFPRSACNKPCAGNSTEMCGAWGFGEIYNTSVVALPAVQRAAASRPKGWQGCFNNYGSNLLKDWKSGILPTLTVENCLASCAELKYSFAGVQNGNACVCGNTDPKSVMATEPSNLYCTIKCGGNSSETCGGPYSAVEVYTVSNVTGVPAPGTANLGYKGCYQGVAGLNSYLINASPMTVQFCSQSCRELGFSLAGLSGNGCRCGINWSAGNQLASSSCNMPCTGAANQTCGSTGTTSLYDVTAIPQYSLYSTDPTYMGCFLDNSKRPFNSFSQTSTTMTIEVCKDICKAKGYSLAGVEQSNQCFCGNTQPDASVFPRLPSYLCSTPCAGNAKEICGGLDNYRLSLFSVTAKPASISQANSTSIPAASALPGSGGQTGSVSVSISGAKSGSAAPTGSKSSTATISGVGSVPTGSKLSSQTVSPSISTKSGSSVIASATSLSISTASVTLAKSSTTATSRSSSRAVSSVTQSVIASATSLSRSAGSVIFAKSSPTATSRSSSRAVSSVTQSVTASKPLATSAAQSSTASVVSASSSAVKSATSSVTSPKASSLTSTTRTSVVQVSTSSATPITKTVTAFQSSGTTITKTFTASRSRGTPVTKTLSGSQTSQKTVTTVMTVTASQPPATSSTSASQQEPTLVGCYSPVTTLQHTMTSGSTTPYLCSYWCSANGLGYAALLNGNQCGCLSGLNSMSALPSAQCSTACSGDASATCGGASAISVYQASLHCAA